jgi:tRNA threonylcarbamoyl adenosine modification protein YeaZ
METKIKSILGLDTTGSRLKIALMTPDEQSSQRQRKAKESKRGKFKSIVKKELNQETLLFPLIDKLLNSCGLKLTDISKICTIRGPGRFTGIRIGLTFARMMNALTGVRVVGLTAFEVLAFQAVHSPDFKLWLKNNDSGLIAVLLHAFKIEYYCQIYKWQTDNVHLGGGQGNNRTLPEAFEEPKWMSGEGIKKYLNSFKCRLYCIANMEESPDIYSLAPLNSKKAPSLISKILPENIIMAGKLLTDSNVNPLYLKPAKYELEKARESKMIR